LRGFQAVVAVIYQPTGKRGEAVAEEDLVFATELAMKAGELLRHGYKNPLEIEYKPDGTPVTEIDRQINDIVADEIRRRYPTHGLLGEEADLGTGFERCKWICDPLDGTIPYILGIPHSVFMLALMRDNSLTLSVVYDPFSDRLYSAVRNGGASCNGTAIHVSRRRLCDGYVALGSNSDRFVEGIRRAGGRTELVSGSGYKSMMIACGEAVATIKDAADFHDIAPAALIVEEAGGLVTALDGSQLVLDRDIKGVIISNYLVHRTLIEVCQKAKSP
jgi:fructose-1,6-bisphosphatase/inositol monophosphatase family enzyme